MRQFERINVVGTSGSGKSTFGRALAAALDLPFHEMDRLFWKPNWEESTDDEFFGKIREVTAQPRWVLDGNYTRSIAEKWRRVQLVVWLDLSFSRTLYRVTRRAVGRSVTRQELWPGTGNRESLAKAFLSKDSIIWWMMTSHGKNRRHYGAAMRNPEYAHIEFVRLTSPGQVARCLEELRSSAPPASGSGRAATRE